VLTDDLTKNLPLPATWISHDYVQQLGIRIDLGDIPGKHKHWHASRVFVWVFVYAIDEAIITAIPKSPLDDDGCFYYFQK